VAIDGEGRPSPFVAQHFTNIRPQGIKKKKNKKKKKKKKGKKVFQDLPGGGGGGENRAGSGEASANHAGPLPAGLGREKVLSILEGSFGIHSSGGKRGKGRWTSNRLPSESFEGRGVLGKGSRRPSFVNTPSPKNG